MQTLTVPLIIYGTQLAVSQPQTLLSQNFFSQNLLIFGWRPKKISSPQTGSLFVRSFPQIQVKTKKKKRKDLRRNLVPTLAWILDSSGLSATFLTKVQEAFFGVAV